MTSATKSTKNLPSIRDNSMAYTLTDDDESISVSRKDRYNDWISPNRDEATVYDHPSTYVGLVGGINAAQPLYLNMAWSLGRSSNGPVT